MITVNQMLRQFKRHNTTLANGIKLISLEKGIFDLYTSEGFNSHSRYRFLRNRWVHISGTRLSDEFIKTNLPIDPRGCFPNR